MPRSLLTSSLLVMLTLGGAQVVAAQRPGATPRATDDAARKPTPPRSSGRPATPPASTPVAVPAVARYRVTLTGFHVNRETYDTFLETDGKGDEIRLTATVQPVGPNGEAEGAPRQIVTATYGDRNNFPDRIQAGSRSAMGGIKTGDNVPDVPDPWIRREAAQGDRLPLLLWEGELRTGQNGVAIAPIAWEMDSDDKVNPINAVGGLANLLGVVAPITAMVPGTGLLSKAAVVATKIVIPIAQTVKDKGNRPIGLAPQGSQYQFAPQAVIITNAVAEMVLAGKAGARAPGVIEVRYRDPEELKGDYSLFLQVERLP